MDSEYYYHLLMQKKSKKYKNFTPEESNKNFEYTKKITYNLVKNFTEFKNKEITKEKMNENLLINLSFLIYERKINQKKVEKMKNSNNIDKLLLTNKNNFDIYFTTDMVNCFDKNNQVNNESMSNGKIYTNKVFLDKSISLPINNNKHINILYPIGRSFIQYINTNTFILKKNDDTQDSLESSLSKSQLTLHVNDNQINICNDYYYLTNNNEELTYEKFKEEIDNNKDKYNIKNNIYNAYNILDIEYMIYECPIKNVCNKEIKYNEYIKVFQSVNNGDIDEFKIIDKEDIIDNYIVYNENNNNIIYNNNSNILYNNVSSETKQRNNNKICNRQTKTVSTNFNSDINDKNMINNPDMIKSASVEQSIIDNTTLIMNQFSKRKSSKRISEKTYKKYMNKMNDTYIKVIKNIHRKFTHLLNKNVILDCKGNIKKKLFISYIKELLLSSCISKKKTYEIIVKKSTILPDIILCDEFFNLFDNILSGSGIEEIAQKFDFLLYICQIKNNININNDYYIHIRDMHDFFQLLAGHKVDEGELNQEIKDNLLTTYKTIYFRNESKNIDKGKYCIWKLALIIENIIDNYS